MSDLSQGPGWWQASDAKWYPPEQHPSHQPPPQSPQPSRPSPVVPAASGAMSGGMKALVVILAIIVVFIGGCAVLVGTVLKRGVSRISEAADDFSGKSGCDFLSAERAASVLPGHPTLVPIRGLVSLVGVALDTRVLADAPSCMFSPEDGSSVGSMGRMARLQSGEASKVFRQEEARAKGVKVDKGNGLSVETLSYYLGPVDVGDEAFCTSAGLPPSSGVLVRKGDTLVYVSMMPNQEQLDAIGLSADGTGTNFDEANCTLAQQVAKAIIER